jgi:ATP-binding cassette, subfamily B, heavy metal transporter
VPEPAAGMRGLWRALIEVAPHLWPKDARALQVRVVVALVFLLTAKLVNIAVPFAYKAVVDGLSGTGQVALALPLAALLAYGGARLGASFFAEARDAIFARVQQHAGRQIALSVFGHLFRLSLRYHLERRTGELARAIDRGVQAVTFMLSMMLFNIFPTLFEFALVIGILLAGYPWWFALITFLTITAYAGFSIVATEWRTEFRRQLNLHDNEVSAQAVDSLLNYETVKTFTNEA